MRPSDDTSTHQSACDRAVGTKRPAIPRMESANSSKSLNTTRVISLPSRQRARGRPSSRANRDLKSYPPSDLIVAHAAYLPRRTIVERQHYAYRGAGETGGEEDPEPGGVDLS